MFFGAEDGGEHVCLFGFPQAFEVLDLDFLSREDEEEIIG